MTKAWHILREEEGWLLTRRLPARFDLWAETWLAHARPHRLMHQIRQDVWRALQCLRGFSPCIRLRAEAGGWRVRAGGQAPKVAPLHWTQLQAVLDDPRNRARWLRHARATHSTIRQGMVS